MRIIAFEGLDNSGKSTQCKILRDSLRNSGFKVVLPSELETVLYPVIRDLFARKVMRPLMNTLLFTASLIEQWDKVDDDIDFVIFDRYIYSVIAYGVMNGLRRDWIEHVIDSLPRADIVIFLEISVAEYHKRARKSKHLESPFSLIQLESVHAKYEELSKEFKFDVISGFLNKEVISCQVLRRVYHLI